jgi:integrase
LPHAAARSPETARRKPRSAEDRITWKGARAYIDLRDFGFKSRVALKPAGETHATTDPALAAKLARAKVKQLEDERDRRAQLGLANDADFRPFADLHVQQKEEAGKLCDDELDSLARRLDRAAHFFEVVQAAAAPSVAERRRCSGPRNLATISTPDIAAFVSWLGSPGAVEYERERQAGRAGRRGGRPPRPFGEQSKRHHLTALSGLFKRAISLGKLPPHGNPVAHLMDGPRIPPSRTELLEPEELALLLEAARTCPPGTVRGGRAVLACVYELVATHVLTGAREDEVLRLTVGDVDFDRGTVRLRGTKTDTGWSDRVVPLHAQLREILRPYVVRRGVGPRERLLFVSERTGGPVTDWRKALDRVAERAGYPAGAVRTRRFRTSYITHRLLSLDNGVPVTVEQVRQEVGHASYDTIAETYARASRYRERLDPFEFRVEKYRERLAEKLERLRPAA